MNPRELWTMKRDFYDAMYGVSAKLVLDSGRTVLVSAGKVNGHVLHFKDCSFITGPYMIMHNQTYKGQVIPANPVYWVDGEMLTDIAVVREKLGLEKDECPLCAAGIPDIHRATRINRAVLRGEY